MSVQKSIVNAGTAASRRATKRGSEALDALRAVHRALPGASDEGQLLADVCEALVGTAGCRSVWVGYADDECRTLKAAARRGRPDGKAADLEEIRLDDGCGADEIREALDDDRPGIAPKALAERVARAGTGTRPGAVVVLPLRSGASVLGAMLIETGKARAPDAGALDLLHEAAKSLAYGVLALRATVQHARAEACLRRVNRARKTLSAVNRTLVRAADEAALLEHICRIIVDQGGYRYAWVGYARRDAAKGVEVMAHVGIDRAYLEGLRLTWADSELGRGATGTAIRTGQPSLGRNLLDDPDLAPWRDEALRRGFAAISAFPLRVDGEVIGNLSIAASEPDAFDAAEADLLGELADDLAFGIATLRMHERSRQAQETIKRMAEEDALTGLPNRGRLRVRLAAEIDVAKSRNRPLAILMLGVDHFQEINETLGYQQGDAMLCEIAARVAGVAVESANVARVGEAEFAILLPDADAAAACRAAQRLLTALLEPVAIGEIMLDAGGSIGIAIFPGHGADADVLIRRANVAMHQARHHGHGFALYTGGRDRECARRLALIGDLHRAIENSELRLYCQPKARFSSGDVCGVEALVRWQHPQLGMISPSEFIGLAEHSGLISPLTDWVMQAAFRQSYVWREAGLHVPVAVNLSARDLRDPKLLERVRNHFATWGAAPEGVQFELTESALMQDPQGSLECLKRLKDLGSELFVDDFGTGYSSLAYLQKLPVDAIKIDKSFVQDMLSNSDSAVIVRSTIDLAHDLDLEVVAEGVESRAGWERLSAQGCDVGQGYVISEPILAEAFGAWRSARALGPRLI